MNIAIVRTSSTILSAQTYNIQELGLARALVAEGHSCDVYLAGDVRAPQFRPHEIRLPTYSLPGHQGWFPALRGLLERNRYDLIQVHEDSQVESVRTACWARKRRIPIVLCQGMYANYAGAATAAAQAIYDRTLLPLLRRNTRAVTAKSRAAGEYCRRKGFTDVVVNPIGLDTDAFAQPVEVDWRRRLALPSEAEVALYVGAPEPPRRPDVLVEAAAQVAGWRKDFVLVLVGDGPSRERLHASARAALGDRVRWVERVIQAELPSLYRTAAVSLLPTASEIYGMAALESMYFGTPVIASREGGLIDLIGQDSGGALLESLDPSVWASGIEDVLSRNHDERTMAQRACRARAQGLTWSALAPRYAAFYERVAGW